MRRSERWKTLERTAAEALGGTRVIESWTLFRQRPDAVVNLSDGRRLIVECKAYRRLAHHGMLEAVQRKYCQPGDVPCLVSKHEKQVGEYVTVPMDFLAELLKRKQLGE